MMHLPSIGTYMMRFLLSMILPATLLLAQNAPVAAPGEPKTSNSKTQEFIFNNGTEPRTLDPALMTGTPEFRLFMALYEGLVVANPKSGKAEPGLAKSWDVSDDMKTYTFKLRKALWSDGTPITSQDVVDSWLRIMDPKTKAEYSFVLAADIAGAKAFFRGEGSREGVKIRAVDPQTFEVTFAEPMPQAIDMLTRPWYGIMPMHAIKKSGKDWAKPGTFVGNGPFVLKEWAPRQRIIVTKNANYWDAANVRLDRISFLPIEDQAMVYDKFKAGEIDWMEGIDKNRYSEIKSRPDYQHVIGSTIYYYLFNVYKKPLDDRNVRKALSMAINREELCEKVLGTGMMPTGGFVPPMGNFVTAKGNTFNPEEAKKLLAEAGYPGGKGFPKFRIIYNTNPNHKKIAEWVQEQWKTILGIEVKIDDVEWGKFLDRRSKHDFEISRGGWQADFSDPTNFLFLFRTRDGYNDGQYSNPKFDALLEQASLLPLGEKRDMVLMEAEEALITQDQAVVPFYFYINQDLIDLNKWGGWYAHPMGVHPWKTIFRK